jgi:hypothetical protein
VIRDVGRDDTAALLEQYTTGPAVIRTDFNDDGLAWQWSASQHVSDLLPGVLRVSQTRERPKILDGQRAIVDELPKQPSQSGDRLIRNLVTPVHGVTLASGDRVKVGREIGDVVHRTVLVAAVFARQSCPIAPQETVARRTTQNR